MKRTRLVLASQNPGKLAELARALCDLPVELIPVQEILGESFEVEETGGTFEANARIKARAVLEASGLASLADDSGLEVDALGGRPGVRSARYAGERASDEDNLRKLLDELDGIEPPLRGARFRCVLGLAVPAAGHDVLLVSGSVEGRIALAARGGGGFGYDPVFELPTGRTMAELTFEEKGRVSHRTRAIAHLRAHLEALPK